MGLRILSNAVIHFTNCINVVLIHTVAGEQSVSYKTF